LPARGAQGAPVSRERAATAPASFDVTAFGARGDGTTPATRAIQQALDACAAAGGGEVVLPPGKYLSGALFLRSNIHVHLSAGATLVASSKPEDYPPIAGRWEGIEQKTHSSLLTGLELENVSIGGSGQLDGQGVPWWERHDATRRMREKLGLPREAENPPGAPLRWPRPRLINLIRCQKVTLADIRMHDSPSYYVHLTYCQDVVVDGVNIEGLQSQNTDGVVIDSSSRVRVVNCSIGSGGESVSLKSGYNEDGRRVNLPCEEVVVANCHFYFSHGAGVAIGSETSGGVRNITVTNCTIADARFGVHIRSPRGRGGTVENVRMTDLVLNKIQQTALFISHFFDSLYMSGLFSESAAPRGNPETDRTIRPRPGESTPTFRNFEFAGIAMRDVPEIAVIEGLPERFIEDITIRDVLAGEVRGGVSCARVAGLTLSGLQVKTREWSPVTARHAQRLEVHRLRCAATAAKAPAVLLQNVAGAFIHGCDAPTAVELVRLEGEDNRHVTIADNNGPSGPPHPPTKA
jgi:polygalacturonase